MGEHAADPGTLDLEFDTEFDALAPDAVAIQAREIVPDEGEAITEDIDASNSAEDITVQLEVGEGICVVCDLTFQDHVSMT